MYVRGFVCIMYVYWWSNDERVYAKNIQRRKKYHAIRYMCGDDTVHDERGIEYIVQLLYCTLNGWQFSKIYLEKNYTEELIERFLFYF